MRLNNLVAAAAIVVIPTASFAALDVTDTSIINLYQFNEQTSGDLTNGTPGSFLDTAVTGSAQNHDDLSASSPTWTSGLGVGDGVGLVFNRSETDYTRFSGWMATSQGAYQNGESFTVMVRFKAASLEDNQTYTLLGTGSHSISLSGIGTPNSALVNIQVRDQNTFFSLNSAGAGANNGSTGANFTVVAGNWYNAFLIYDQNSSLTVALDDGTTFFSQTTTGGVPAGFNTLGELFDNAGNHWFVGSTGGASNTFDGTIESIAIWDKALTTTEANAIDLTTTIPEPVSASTLLSAGMLGLLRRRRA